MAKRQLQGEIVSAKTLKTVVVKVERFKEYPKYRKKLKIWKKYKAHVEGGDWQVGDKVVIEECRPISKDKHWIVIKKA